MRPTVGVIFVLMVLACALALAHGIGPVSRARLARFARRQRLEITVGNGEQVIRYLAAMRQWHTAGLLGGLVVSIAIGIQSPRPDLSYIPLFGGWFVGAIIGETRRVTSPTTTHRTASLTLRDSQHYIGRVAWALTPALATISMAGSITTLLLVRPRPHLLAVVTPAAVALLVSVLIAVAGHRIVGRAHPHPLLDNRAADDAIRSRGLHVLSGTGTALVVWCIATQLSTVVAIHPGSTPHHHLRTAVVLAGGLLGRLIATATFTATAVPRTTGSEAVTA